MAQNIGPSSRFVLLRGSWFIFLLLFVPIAFSNHPGGALAGMLLLTVVFIFPGYLLLKLASRDIGFVGIFVGPVFGIAVMTTGYDIFARVSIAASFPYLVAAISLAGTILIVWRARQADSAPLWPRDGYQTLLAGFAAAFCLAPLFWRSGRFSGSEFVFYGPAGHDHLYHLTLLQRLAHHIPPDNFIVSGLRAPVYHYFDDLALALVLRCQAALHLGTTDLFDLYYRCYPTLVYFLIGALAYRAGKQLVGSPRGGVLSVLLLLGGGGLGWFFGALQAAVHAPHFVVMRAFLFSEWTSWDGVDSILPLVHRPAHYHSLLICLAAVNLLLRPERSRRDWLLAGLLLGMMAGFNLTLAATFGVAGVFGYLIFLLQHRQRQAWDLGCFSLSLFIGSLPVNLGMLFAGFHNTAPGFPFHGPNLQFPVATWGGFLGRIVPSPLVPWASLIVLPIVAYGVRLFGLGALRRRDLGGEDHAALALVLAVAFTLSFVVGTFFPYQAFGGVGIVFLQPSLWILGLFSLRPIDAWLKRGWASWRPLALWGMLGLTWLQALGAFNFSYKVSFDRDTVHALQKVRYAASPDDVVAYLPDSITAIPIWGHAEESTNFAVIALTGLDGYFCSETYSKFFAVSGLSGRTPQDILLQAERLYQQRRSDVESFVDADIEDATSARMATDHVRWIVVLDPGSRALSPSATPWQKTGEIAIYRLPR